jgi:hypothetical protein
MVVQIIPGFFCHPGYAQSDSVRFHSGSDGWAWTNDPVRFLECPIRILLMKE